jgi:hypothetical protein
MASSSCGAVVRSAVISVAAVLPAARLLLLLLLLLTLLSCRHHACIWQQLRQAERLVQGSQLREECVVL